MLEEDFDSRGYFDTYWPRQPTESSIWEENVALLRAYYDAASVIRSRGDTRLRNLDISTGPTLAPLMAISNVIESAQLTDFKLENFEVLSSAGLEYWRGYANVIASFSDDPIDIDEEGSNIIKRLSTLVNESKPKFVDVCSEPMFKEPVDFADYNLITMHFVLDSITDDRDEYLSTFKKLLGLIQSGSYFLMSVLLDSTYWLDGSHKHPSPEISLLDVSRLFENSGFEILFLRESPGFSDQTYDGRFGVFLSIKR